MDFEKRFLEFVSQNNLIEKSDRVLLAVSGGIDSMVMLHIFKKWFPHFAVAHCNFQLRGKESDEDELFVKDCCNRFRISFHLQAFDTKAHSLRSKKSVQETGRDLRYSFFRTLATTEGYDKIATAHHQDDSIESFFINLSRGTGLAGLKGIPLQNEKIIRPMLFATRQDIEQYAALENISFRNDSSNDSDDYLRNRIRHQVVPAVSASLPHFKKSMVKNFRIIASSSDLLNNFISEWIRENVTTDQFQTEIPLEALHRHPFPETLLDHVLHYLGFISPETQKILNAAGPGKYFDYGDRSISVDRSSLIIFSPGEHQPFETTILQGMTEADTPYGKVTFTPSPSSKSGANDLAVSGDNLHFPLVIRTWRHGDSFEPSGMNGTKKISDYFADNKFSLPQKLRTLILLSGNNIVCILGHRIDKKFVVTEKTNSILYIEFAGYH